MKKLKGNIQKTYLVLILSLLTFHISQGQSMLDKLRTLPVDTGDYSIKVYYSPGGEKKAAELGPMLNDALLYFNRNLNTRLDLRLALLNEDHWRQVRKTPYGLPFVDSSTSPAVAVLPVTSGGSVYEFLLDLEENVSQTLKEEVASLGYSWEAFSAKVVDLVAFHEIGHPYAKAYGIGLPTLWLNEFVANYFAYLYMYKNAPEMAKVWKLSGDIIYDGHTPKHKTLEEFNELYSGVGVPNYAWYQAAFEKKANPLVEEKGVSFLHDLKQKFPEDVGNISNEEILNRLEEISPGFKEWARIFEKN